MSQLSNLQPRLRDDSEARVIALATRARKELGISPDEVDWDSLFERVSRQYKQGIKEEDIDWKLMVEQSLLKKTPHSREVRENRRWSNLLALNRPVYALVQLATLLIVVVLSLYALRTTSSISDLRSQLNILRQEKERLEQNYAKIQSEVEQMRSASEQLIRERDDIQARLTQLEGESRATRTVVVKKPSEPRIVVDASGLVAIRGGRVTLPDGTQLPANLSNLVSQLATTGAVRPSSDTRAALAALPKDFVRGGSSSDGAPVLISPVQTAVRSTTPTLKWQPVPGVSEYKIVVAEAEEPHEISWESTVADTQGTVPAGRLRLGTAYLWHVEASLKDKRGKLSPAVGFWVLSESALLEIEKTEQSYGNSPLVLACLYAKHGLYEEAFDHLKKISDKNAADSPVRLMLQELRRLLGKVNL